MPFLEADPIRVDSHEPVSVYVERMEEEVAVDRRIDVWCRSGSYQVDDPFGILRCLDDVIPQDILIVDVLKQVGRVQLPPNGAMHASNEHVLFDSAPK